MFKSMYMILEEMENKKERIRLEDGIENINV